MKIEYVHFIPDDLKNDTLYISMEYGAVIHKCPCGCNIEVSTPIKPMCPTGWDLLVENNSVSLSPSISSYQRPCKSHYFIKKNEIIWC